MRKSCALEWTTMAEQEREERAKMICCLEWTSESEKAKVRARKGELDIVRDAGSGG